MFVVMKSNNEFYLRHNFMIAAFSILYFFLTYTSETVFCKTI